MSEIHLRYRQAVESAGPPQPRAPRPIVVLGAGGIVRAAHLPAYAKAGLPVIALADVVPGRAAALAHEYGIGQGFDSVAEAVRYAPGDAVFDLAVPASELRHLLPLLPRAAAVLIQKPMGETIEDARAIRALSRERAITAAVNFQLRYSPAHLGARALAAAGLLGTLHDVEVQVRTYTPWQLWSFLASAPRLEILYHSIHYLDLLRAWLGEPRSIYAKTVRSPQTAELAATKSSMLLDYGDLMRVTVSTTHVHQWPESQLSFVQWEGTAGAIRMGMGVNLDYPNGKPDQLAYAIQGEPSWHSLSLSGNWFPDAFAGSMGALQAYVEGSVPALPSSVEDAFHTMALVEAAYRSSVAGGTPIDPD